MNAEHGTTLLRLARGAIGARFGETAPAIAADDWLAAPGASFVTLTQHGALRGCIGSLAARQPLHSDVIENAEGAAFRDPRFPPVTARDYPQIAVEVSVLSAMELLNFESESHLLAQLRPGVDGLVIEHDWHRGTFLPQVWNQLPDAREFLAHLKNKAGLPADFWSPTLKVSRYTVTKWRERDAGRGH